METISDKIFEQYGELANTKGISSIPEPAQTLMAVYAAQGIIGNGGFAYFFESDFPDHDAYKTIIKCYRNLGLEHHAKSIEEVLSLFPGKVPHKNIKEREEFIYKYMSGDDEENYSPVVEKAENIFFNDSDRVYELADEYAEKYV